MERILVLEKKMLFLGLVLLLGVIFTFMPGLEIPSVVFSNDAADENTEIADVIITKSRKGSI